MIHKITTDQLNELLNNDTSDERKKELYLMITAVVVKPLPQSHADAVGLAYYDALSASEPWSIVNGTGTVIALLMTSIEDAGSLPSEALTIERMFKRWSAAMEYYGTPNDDREKYHAAYVCQEILGHIGKLAYKYGRTPAWGYKLTPTTGGKQ